MKQQTTFPENEQTFQIEGPAGLLEILTDSPKESAINKIAIICHPHPLHQGTMHNKVVTTLAKTFKQMGMRTVRFNFRGVGKSEGKFGNMDGEVDDLKALLAWVKQLRPNDKIWLAGFSFGAYIAAKIASEKTPEQLISIAPAVHHADYYALPKMQCPWLVVQGENDEIVPPEQVYSWVEKSISQPMLIRMPETSHFFHGKLNDLRDILLEHFGF